MLRKFILIPAFLIGVALFVTASTASAHPPGPGHHHPVHFGPPIGRPYFPPPPIFVGPIVRPIPAPIYVPVYSQYRVVYRANCNVPWQTYNVYNSRAYATDVASDLQRQSFEAQVWTN